MNQGEEGLVWLTVPGYTLPSGEVTGAGVGDRWAHSICSQEQKEMNAHAHFMLACSHLAFPVLYSPELLA